MSGLRDPAVSRLSYLFLTFIFILELIMKKCLSCNMTYSSQLSDCENCGWLSPLMHGRIAYSPHLALENSRFKTKYFAELAVLEAMNFWFRARNQLILWALGKYYPEFHSILKIGWGTGYVLSGMVEASPSCKYSGSEFLVDGLSVAEARHEHPMEYFQMDTHDIPFEEDSQVLKQIYQALKPKGILLFSVTQHQWSWSQADEFACHVRRYSAKELYQKVKQVGFEILRSTSFVFFLLSLMMISRLRQRSEEKNEALYRERHLPFFLNKSFDKNLAIENYFVRE